MHAHDISVHATSRPERQGAPRAILVPGPADAVPAVSRSVPTSHGRAALANALDEGLMPDEVARILRGRRIVAAFPVRRGETPAEYAARAVAEMFVAYLQ